jgi:putative phosphoribosyl transferase
MQPMPNRALPVRPDIRQYRKQAKELVKAASHAETLARIRRHHPRWNSIAGPDPPSFKLTDAQLVIAREHGFESWPRFVAHINELNAQQPPPTQRGIDKSPQLLSIALSSVVLDAELGRGSHARGLIVLAHASGSSRYRPAFRRVALAFNAAGWNTLSLDLLTDDEELYDGALADDFRLLGGRLAAVTDWIAQEPQLDALPLGYWAAGIGAAAMIFAAGERASVVRALVSSGGRPDLAGSSFWKVQAPVLLIAGGADSVGLGFNRLSDTIFPPHSVHSFRIVPGANQHFDTPETQSQAIALACDWFHQYLPRKED